MKKFLPLFFIGSSLVFGAQLFAMDSAQETDKLIVITPPTSPAPCRLSPYSPSDPSLIASSSLLSPRSSRWPSPSLSSTRCSSSSLSPTGSKKNSQQLSPRSQSPCGGLRLNMAKLSLSPREGARKQDLFGSNQDNAQVPIQTLEEAYVHCFCEYCKENNASSMEALFVTNQQLEHCLSNSNAVRAFCSAMSNDHCAVIESIMKNDSALLNLIRGKNFSKCFSLAFQKVCFEKCKDMVTILLSNQSILEKAILDKSTGLIARFSWNLNALDPESLNESFWQQPNALLTLCRLYTAAIMLYDRVGNSIRSHLSTITDSLLSNERFLVLINWFFAKGRWVPNKNAKNAQYILIDVSPYIGQNIGKTPKEECSSSSLRSSSSSSGD